MKGTSLVALVAFYCLTLREMSQIYPQVPASTTVAQLRTITETPTKETVEPTPKQPVELARVVQTERHPLSAKQRSKVRRDLEVAIARAEKALADADEDSQEDEWGAAERRYLGTELKDLPAERRARAETAGRRTKKTIREIHGAEAKAARMQLEDLRARLAEIEAENE